MKAHFFTLILLVGVSPAFAQDSSSPREQLKQYVAELQKSPGDQVLREKIIKLGLTLDPKPAAPYEVDELAGRAKYAIEHATSAADYVAAAEAFGKASLLAPWVPEYYFNEGISYEKAQRLDDAIKSFQWYLVAAPDAQDAKAVRERVGGLKFAAEKAAREAETNAAARRRQLEATLAEWLRAQAITALLDAVRQSVYGKEYATFVCNRIDPARLASGTRFEGCNLAESQGSNWYNMEDRPTIVVSNGTIKVDYVWGHLIGTPTGSTLGEVRWEWSGRQSPLWATLSADGEQFVCSSDRPPDSSEFNPATRYQYIMIRQKR